VPNFNLNLSAATRWGLNLVALLGVVFALWLGQSIFIPTVIAVLLAAMLWPAARWLNERLRVPWGLACMVVIGGLVVLTVTVTLGLALAIPKMLQDLPNERERQQEVYTRFRERLEWVSPVPLDPQYFPEDATESKAFNYIKQTLDPSQPYMINILWRIAAYGNNWVWHWVLIMFILLFVLLEGRMLSRRVVEILGPSMEAKAEAVAMLDDMARQVRTYLVWRTIVNFGMALILGAVYQTLGLQQSWTWALLTSILWYIPYLGPIAAGIPPIIDAFLSCPSPWYAVGVLGLYVAVIILEGYVIVPVVMGRSMELNATTVMLACLFWDLVWGTPGLFLAMPLMAGIKAICDHMPGMRPWANLMSTREDIPPPRRPAKSEPTLALEQTMLLEEGEPPVSVKSE
jgi:AI-2 transport protein TqsA